ncbi:TPA: hypothetical protein ACGXP3_004849 [Bacillus cereus]
MCDVDTTQHIGRGLERVGKRDDKHRGNTARATTTESGIGAHAEPSPLREYTRKENDREGGERANRGTDERSGKRKKSDTTEKKRKQVEYRGELTSL